MLFQLHNNHPGHLVVVYFMSCSPQTCITLILGGHFPPPLWQLERYLQQEQNGKLMSTNSTVLLQPVQLAITRFEATTPAWLELLWAHLFIYFFCIPPSSSPTLSHFKRLWSPYVNEHLWYLESQGV